MPLHPQQVLVDVSHAIERQRLAFAEQGQGLRGLLERVLGRDEAARE